MKKIVIPLFVALGALSVAMYGCSKSNSNTPVKNQQTTPAGILTGGSSKAWVNTSIVYYTADSSYTEPLDPSVYTFKTGGVLLIDQDKGTWSLLSSNTVLKLTDDQDDTAEFTTIALTTAKLTLTNHIAFSKDRNYTGETIVLVPQSSKGANDIHPFHASVFVNPLRRTYTPKSNQITK